jgi:hypothetical protein
VSSGQISVHLICQDTPQITILSHNIDEVRISGHFGWLGLGEAVSLLSVESLGPQLGETTPRPSGHVADVVRVGWNEVTCHGVFR